jgi:hypothetical protein
LGTDRPSRTCPGYKYRASQAGQGAPPGIAIVCTVSSEENGEGEREDDVAVARARSLETPCVTPNIAGEVSRTMDNLHYLNCSTEIQFRHPATIDVADHRRRPISPSIRGLRCARVDSSVGADHMGAGNRARGLSGHPRFLTGASRPPQPASPVAASITGEKLFNKLDDPPRYVAPNRDQFLRRGFVSVVHWRTSLRVAPPSLGGAWQSRWLGEMSPGPLI